MHTFLIIFQDAVGDGKCIVLWEALKEIIMPFPKQQQFAVSFIHLENVILLPVILSLIFSKPLFYAEDLTVLAGHDPFSLVGTPS